MAVMWNDQGKNGEGALFAGGGRACEGACAAGGRLHRRAAFRAGGGVRALRAVCGRGRGGGAVPPAVERGARRGAGVSVAFGGLGAGALPGGPAGRRSHPLDAQRPGPAAHAPGVRAVRGVFPDAGDGALHRADQRLGRRDDRPVSGGGASGRRGGLFLPPHGGGRAVGPHAGRVEHAGDRLRGVFGGHPAAFACRPYRGRGLARPGGRDCGRAVRGAVRRRGRRQRGGRRRGPRVQPGAAGPELSFGRIRARRAHGGPVRPDGPPGLGRGVRHLQRRGLAAGRRPAGGRHRPVRGRGGHGDLSGGSGEGGRAADGAVFPQRGHRPRRGSAPLGHHEAGLRGEGPRQRLGGGRRGLGEAVQDLRAGHQRRLPPHGGRGLRHLRPEGVLLGARLQRQHGRL